MTNPTDPKMPCHVESWAKATGETPIYTPFAEPQHGNDMFEFHWLTGKEGQREPDGFAWTRGRADMLARNEKDYGSVPDHDSPAWGWAALNGMVEQGALVYVESNTHAAGNPFEVHIGFNNSAKCVFGPTLAAALCAAINGHPCDKE